MAEQTLVIQNPEHGFDNSNHPIVVVLREVTWIDTKDDQFKDEEVEFVPRDYLEVQNSVLSLVSKSPNLTSGQTFYNGILSHVAESPNLKRDRQLEIQNSILSFIGEPPVITLGASYELEVQNSVIKNCPFSPELTTGGGLHDNTMWIEYDGTDYLKCAHQHGRLDGSFLSPIYDKSSSTRRMVYVLTEMTVIGVGTTWDSQIPLTLTGANLLTNGDFANWSLNEPDDWTEVDCEADEEVGGQAGSGCKITTSANNGGIYQAFAVTAGKWYRLDGYYKNGAGDTFCFATYDATNSKWIDPEIGYPEEDVTASWTAFSHLFKAPVGCASIRLYLMGRTSGDIVYVDSLVLKEIDEVNSTIWSDIGISLNSWGDVFDVSAAPDVNIRLYYGDTSPPTSYVDNMEILSTIVTAQYFRVRISIVDPTDEIYAYIMHYILEFCTYP